MKRQRGAWHEPQMIAMGGEGIDNDSSTAIGESKRQ